MLHAGAVVLTDAFWKQEHMEGARAGDRAHMHSMLQTPDKNTRACELLRFDDTRARWMVRMTAAPEGELTRFWVKSCNLFPLLRVGARVKTVGGAINSVMGRITGRDPSTDRWSIITDTGDTLQARACHVFPEVYIGSVVSIITPHFPWYHRREATIVGYDTESKLWKILMECDTDNVGRAVPYDLYELGMQDEYVVPYHREGDMVVLDKEDSEALQGARVQLGSLMGETVRAHRWTVTFRGQTLVRSAFQLRSAGEDASRLSHGCAAGPCRSHG